MPFKLFEQIGFWVVIRIKFEAWNNYLYDSMQMAQARQNQINDKDGDRELKAMNNNWKIMLLLLLLWSQQICVF